MSRVMAIRDNYSNRVVHVFKAFFYIVSFTYVKNNLYFWSRSYSKQPLLWPLLCKQFIPLYTFLKFHTHLEENSARSFQNVFEKCSRVLNLQEIEFFMSIAIF